MMPSVRTTLTLDDDVAHQLQQRARRSGASFRQVVNEALRAGLQADKRPEGSLPAFQVTPVPGPFRSGVDLLRLNQLSDEMETEAFEDELARSADRA